MKRPESVNRGAHLLAFVLLTSSLWVGIWTPAVTHAQSPFVVTECSSDAVTGAGKSLGDALTAGASAITFACPPGAVIRVENSWMVSPTTRRIDGSNSGDPITLLNTMPTSGGAIRFVLQLLPDARTDVLNLHFQSATPAENGGIDSQGILRVIGSTFDGFYIGLDASRGELIVQNSRFLNSVHGVGLDLGLRRALIEGALFRDNLMGVGGSHSGHFPVTGGSLVVSGSIFAHNRAPIQHCADDDCPQTMPLIVVNSIINATDDSDAVNSAVRGRAIAIINSTIVSNGDIGVQGEGETTVEAITLANTIIADHSANCRGNVLDAGHNLQWGDDTCTGIPVAAPRLSNRFEPLTGSPTLAAGDPAICASRWVNSRDYYRQTRPRAASCSIGAVEGVLEQPPVIPGLPREDE